MGKIIKNAVLGLLVVAFLLFAGVMMNKSAKLLEHWAYPTGYSDIVEQKSAEYGVPLSVIYAVRQLNAEGIACPLRLFTEP